MAEIPYVESVQDPQGRKIGYHWPNVTENDTCQPVRIYKDDVTMSVTGTLGGATLELVIDGHTASSLSLTSADTGGLVTEGGISYVPTFTGGSSQSATPKLIAQ